ncbi:glycosyltransferase family 1 protein [Leucothrix sargassi]|nr:glycosyltransferase family 1 protein [Leucothrix sargassi]
MMKVVHVIEPMSHGVFIWVIDMANNLVENGYDVTILHSLRDETPENWRELFDPRVKLVHIQMGRAINPITDIRALYKITREIMRIKPDVIHGHSSKSGVLARVAGFLLGQNKRTLYTSHAIHYPLIDNPVKRMIYKSLELVSYWMGGTIIACSQREYEIILKEITNGKAHRLACISNGIDLTQVTQKDYSKQSDKVRIGVLGRISNQKAPWVFASIAKTLLAKHDNVEFVWVGAGDEEYETVLKEAGVSITGFLDRDSALETVATLDVFLQTSLYEGLSLALLEAQAAGIPAVVSNIPGNDEVVQHEQTGYVGDHEETLAQFTEELILSAELRQQLGQGARQYVEDNFSFDAMGDKYKALYEQAATAYPKKVVSANS